MGNKSVEPALKFEQVVTHVTSIKGPLKVTAAGLAAKTKESVMQQEQRNNDNDDMRSPTSTRPSSANDNHVLAPPGSTPFQSYSQSSSRQSSARADETLAPPGSTPFHSREPSAHEDSWQFSFRGTTSSSGSTGGGSDWGLALARLRFLKDPRFALNEILTHEDLYLSADLLASTSNDPNIVGGQVGGCGVGVGNPFTLLH